MARGTVKWFNAQKGMDLFSLRAEAEGMCLSISPPSKRLASAV